MALQDGFKILSLKILAGGGGYTGGALTANSKDLGSGFVGTYGATNGVLDTTSITNNGKNYSSGSWGGRGGSDSEMQGSFTTIDIEADAGSFIFAGGSGSIIVPTIGQDTSMSFSDLNIERGVGEETEADIHELYEDFASVAGGDPIRHDLLDHKPNFDWWQGGPRSSSVLHEYQSHPIRLDEFYGSTYDAYGGHGCLGLGTPITMADGTTKNIEDLNIGDWVRAATVPGMPLDFDEEDTWTVWSGTPHGNPPGSVWATAYYDIQEINRVTPASASIQNIYFDWYDNYYLINGSLKVTYEHPFFVTRDGSYYFKTTVSLELGDKLFKTDNEFEEVSSIEFVNEPLETVNFDVESLDVYFGGGYLMHNVHGK